MIKPFLTLLTITSQGMIVAEHYLEAIADKLKLDIDHVRSINLYAEAQKTPYHQKVVDWHVPRLLKDCVVSSDYHRRRAAVDQFNLEHKYRKRGISLLPTKFGVRPRRPSSPALAHLRIAARFRCQGHESGLVSRSHLHGWLSPVRPIRLGPGAPLIRIRRVAHGGTEMGQGLYAKCCQIAAQELRVPMEAVFTSETATNAVPNAVPTAGSAGSDLQGFAVHKACVELNSRLEPYRLKLGPDAPLSALAGAAWGDRVSLSATGQHATPDLGYEWG